MIRHAHTHGSPEHWRGRYLFRANTGWDPEEMFTPDEYTVAPADDGTPTVALNIRALRRLRDMSSDTAAAARLDQFVALLSEENSQIEQGR